MTDNCLQGSTPPDTTGLELGHAVMFSCRPLALLCVPVSRLKVVRARQSADQQGLTRATISSLAYLSAWLAIASSTLAGGPKGYSVWC